MCGFGSDAPLDFATNTVQEVFEKVGLKLHVLTNIFLVNKRLCMFLFVI